MNNQNTAPSLRLPRLAGLAMLFIFVALLPVLAHAQSGSVSGHVVDKSGASVPGANVEIINTAINETTVVRTNDQGYYLFPPLTPGDYVVHASAPGFAKVTVSKFTLEVSGSRTLDLSLVPETVSQSVTVTADAPELVVDHPDRGNVIESEFVQNTPLNIRNPLQLVNFAQGVTPYSSESGNNDQSEAYTNTFRINGGKLATTESLLDGGANTTQYDYNAIAAVPQVDAILEFKVLTDAYAPEWGHTSGGIVTFATKSGTDHFHGSMYDYLRNSLTDANNFNSDWDTPVLPKPNVRRNQYGYALGGPLTLPTPHLLGSSHRTFFYSTYEGLRQSIAVLPSAETYTVPTALERTGDFSQSYDSKGNLIVLYDPSTTTLQPTGSTACTSTPVAAGQTVYCRSPFPGNKITNLDTAGKALLNSYPLPNQTGVNGSAVNNYFVNSPPTSIQDTVNFRIDHKFSEKHSLFGRFDWFQRFNYFGDPYLNNLSPTANHQRLPGDNIMVEHTWEISPFLVFEHHFVRAHQESNRTPETLGFNPTTLGFAGNVSSILTSTTFPSISVSATSPDRMSALGPQSGLEADGGTTYQYAASLSWLKGKHALKFGFDYRDLQEDFNVNQLLTVTSSYVTNFTAGPYVEGPANAGSGYADLLLGTGTVTTGFQPGYHWAHPYIAGYAQDEYHITPKLTATFGLRYSVELPDIEKHNQFIDLNLTTTSPLNSQVTVPGVSSLTGGPGFVGTNGVGSLLQKTEWTNFDPRLGFAYRLSSKTVIRGGFGIFHAPSFLLIGSATSIGYSATTTSLPAPANGVTPNYNMDNPFTVVNTPTGSSQGLDTNIGLPITGYPLTQSVSYSEQWSADVQRQLPHNFVVTIGYAGNHALHLYVPYNYNQLPDSDLSQGSALLATPANNNPFASVIGNPSNPLYNPNSPLSKSSVPQWKLEIPHPQFGNMTANFLGIGSSEYNAMQLAVERRFSQGLALLFDYTFSRMYDNAGDYFGMNNFQDNYCSSCDWSISSQDITHVIRISGQYELPIGKGKPFANNGILAETIGGWAIGSFYTFDSGTPVQIIESNNTSGFGGGSVMRPNVVPGVSPGKPHFFIGGPLNSTSQFFNPAAFTKAPAYTFGNAPKYIDGIRNPGGNNWDMMVTKHFPLYESFALDFSVQAFNAFNRVQFAGPTASNGASIGSNSGSLPANFGQVIPTQANSPRSLQGSLRLSF